MNRNGVIFVTVLASALVAGAYWRSYSANSSRIPGLPPEPSYTDDVTFETPELRARERAALAQDYVYGKIRKAADNECFPAEDATRLGKVLINSHSLVSGIPGTGPLTVAELEKWLANPKVHEPLDFSLPAGLDSLWPKVYIPADNPLTRAKIELGRQLFFDRRLSRRFSGSYSCQNCHPAPHYSDPGVGGSRDRPEHDRSIPVNLNRLFSKEQFWDGRAASLEAQVPGPLFSDHEMGNDPETLLLTLQRMPGYRLQFERLFGEVTVEAVAKALASFQRTLVTFPTRYDYHVAWEEWKDKPDETLSALEQAEKKRLQTQVEQHPLNPAELRGRDLFFSERVGCAQCHSGANFTDEKFHNLGYSVDGAGKEDVGRYAVTQDEKDRGAFKTPTLRNVLNTARYFRNHQMSSVAEVIHAIAKGGGPGSNKSPLLKPFTLTEEERADLLSFVNCLTGGVPQPSTRRFPEGVSWYAP